MLWYAFNSYICEVCISSFENSLVNNDAKKWEWRTEEKKTTWNPKKFGKLLFELN